MTSSATGTQDRRRRAARTRTAVSGPLLSVWLRVVRPTALQPPVVKVTRVFRSVYGWQLPPPAACDVAQCSISRAQILQHEGFAQPPRAPGSPDVFWRDRAAPGTRPLSMDRAPMRPRMDRAPMRPPGRPQASQEEVQFRSRRPRYRQLLASLLLVVPAVAKTVLAAAGGGATGRWPRQ